MNTSITYPKALLGLLFLAFQGCGNDWPTKDQVKDLEGEWKLVSVKATDKLTSKDTTWASDGGFIRFGYTGKSGATPITYALAEDQVIDGFFSVPSENELLLMPKDPVSGYEQSSVGLPVSHRNAFQVSDNQLIITGECIIKDGNQNLTSGKRMNLIAIFKK